jgi:pimeloyl-ACP methyl ester carboxylesterase
MPDAIHGARFHVLDDTGHMPQLETPDLVIEVISAELRAGEDVGPGRRDG